MTDSENRKIIAEKYISTLQEHFPNVTVTWNPPPNPVFELNPCKLEFISKKNPELIHEVPFGEGLGSSPTEADINALIVLARNVLESF